MLANLVRRSFRTKVNFCQSVSVTSNIGVIKPVISRSHLQSVRRSITIPTSCRIRRYSTEKDVNNSNDADNTKHTFESNEDSESQHEPSDSRGGKTEEIKLQILDNALEFVVDYGWSREAISNGAELAGYAGVAEGMFPGGGEDLLMHFVKQCNYRLQHFLKESVKQYNEDGVEIKTGEFIRKAVEFRLRLLIPYVSVWSEAMGLLLKPSLLAKSTEELAMMVDDIWHYAGDKSSDISWYTKRGMLAKLYGSTQLVMLMDQSPDFQDTWEFLDRRMEDIKNLSEISQSVTATGDALFKTAFSGATVLKNALGFPETKR